MIYKGLETTQEFRSIVPVMESWVDLCEKIAGAFPQEDDIGFNEGSYVSMLCAASWLVDIPAITELPTKKQGHKNHSPFDILLDTGDIKIAGEAKIAWIGYGNLVDSLKEAQKEASKLSPDLVDHRLGILFVDCWQKQVLDQGSVKEMIKRFRDEQPVGIAWSITAPKPQRAKEYLSGGFMVFSKPC